MSGPEGGVDGPCDSDCIVKKGGTVKDGETDPIIPIGGAPTDGVTTETDTAQFQMSTKGVAQAMSADCSDASNSGGDQPMNPNCQKATVQGDANANGAAQYVPGRK